MQRRDASQCYDQNFVSKPAQRRQGEDALDALFYYNIVVDRKLKVTQQTCQENLDLGERESVADAGTVACGATISVQKGECVSVQAWDRIHSRRQVSPSLWSEVPRIGTPEFGCTIDGLNGDGDDVAMTEMDTAL